uniref:hypothetical protein n=1 Tax=Aggregatibacter actinomycetemcomitans TaxID=714 RepID=UPI00215B55F6|nr:hypothetical protein [Aggregatibacter actinomycetemcomitans]
MSFYRCVMLTLDKLRPYEHNPRKTRNPNFEMIKESIRRRGLGHNTTDNTEDWL